MRFSAIAAAAAALLPAASAGGQLALAPGFILNYDVTETSFIGRMSVEYGEAVWASVGFSTDGDMASASLFVVGVPDEGVGIYDKDVNHPDFPDNGAHSKPVLRKDQRPITASSFYWDQEQKTSFYDFELSLDEIPQNSHELIFAHGKVREFAPPHIVKASYGKIDLDTKTIQLSPGFSLEYSALGTFRGTLKLQQGYTWASIGFSTNQTMETCDLFVVGSEEGIGLYEKDCSNNNGCHSLPTLLKDQSALTYASAEANSIQSTYSFEIAASAIPTYANQLVYAHAGPDAYSFAPGHKVKTGFGAIDLTYLKSQYKCSEKAEECNVCKECCNMYLSEEEVCTGCVVEECNVCEPELGCTFQSQYAQKSGIYEACCQSYLNTANSCNWCVQHFDDEEGYDNPYARHLPFFMK